MSYRIKLAYKAFVEQIQEQSLTAETPWNLGKLRRAQRLLEKGHSAAQIGGILRLSQAQISELEFDATDIEPQPEVESPEAWRSRKAFEIEKKLVTISENHLDGVMELSPGMLDPETAGTVKDMSAIAHKWLRHGEDGGAKSLTLNFGMLAQVKAPHLSDGTKRVYDLKSESDGQPESESLDRT